MASIEFDPEHGFSLIEERLMNLSNDIGTMIEKKEISEEAAKWLLMEFKNIAGICRDCKLNNKEKEAPTIKF